MMFCATFIKFSVSAKHLQCFIWVYVSYKNVIYLQCHLIKICRPIDILQNVTKKCYRYSPIFHICRYIANYKVCAYWHIDETCHLILYDTIRTIPLTDLSKDKIIHIDGKQLTRHWNRPYSLYAPCFCNTYTIQPFRVLNRDPKYGSKPYITDPGYTTTNAV